MVKDLHTAHLVTASNRIILKWTLHA